MDTYGRVRIFHGVNAVLKAKLAGDWEGQDMSADKILVRFGACGRFWIDFGSVSRSWMVDASVSDTHSHKDRTAKLPSAALLEVPPWLPQTDHFTSDNSLDAKTMDLLQEFFFPVDL